METFVRTPMEIFGLPQHFAIPLFQRPYVWDEEEQWEPLWQDVRRVAQLRLEQPHVNATHFLGAVVVQAQENAVGIIATRDVIDGQQRLTTLQLMMDAAAAVLEDTGADLLSAQLQRLTHNDAVYVPPGESGLKIRHANRDREPFDEVMSAEAPVPYSSLKHAESKLARGHAYFAGEIGQWLGEPDTPEFVRRSDALVTVMTRGLQLVTIDLTAAENSQEIFETLNARGTPLTAADLIRNYVFQRLRAEGGDTGKAYSRDWPFETKFWERTVSVGRYTIGRSSLFLNQWLVARTGEEIGPQSTFTRFKHYVEHEAGQKMEDLLPAIRKQAEQYEAWTLAAQESSRQLDMVEMAVYRMAANNMELLKPLLIWLHEPDRDLSAATIYAIVSAAESWVMRRVLLRLTSADLGRVVADLIKTHSSTATDDLADRVIAHLARLNVTSTYWPGDDELRAALATEAAYRRFRRARLRMLLEAVEDWYRFETNQSQLDRKGYPIEHVLPQKWSDFWPVDGIEAQQERAEHVHRLGNLTLLTDRLNPKVSNAGWAKKRTAFLQHNTINMTGRLVVDTEGRDWDENTIDDRTAEMIDVIIKIWPTPVGHHGEVVDPQAKAPDWVEIKHLVGAGLLEPGARLTPRSGQWQERTATILANGAIELEGRRYDSPSGAARALREKATNGWKFWRTADGRRLEEVRAEFRGVKPAEPGAFDWSGLHAILEVLPQGRWTTYGHLAAAVGTAPQAVGNHLPACEQCRNGYRVLKSDGSISPGFTWTDPQDHRDPLDALRDEGIGFVNGTADPAQELGEAELLELMEAGAAEDAEITGF
ncbi:DUF262 domain-containing protein [Isoptericola sp. NPDC058082]|uniref:GmrSD restriction endonuclease domain-containing protein n=1 Tax=Isoptericola sp. NPDC058082 TaxID=3346331 RepID=UPI0036E0EEA8